MIYLILSFGSKEVGTGIEKREELVKYLKIGYTSEKSRKRRYSMYKLHNPTCRVLYEIPGADEDLEKRVHYKFRNLRCKDYGNKDYGNEWYIYSEDIINFFSSKPSIKELNKLPKNPVRGDLKFKKNRRVAKKIIQYLFNDWDDIENYVDKVCKELGDLLDEDSLINYIKSDSTIPSSILSKYLEIRNKMKSNTYSQDKDMNIKISEFLKKYQSLNSFFDKMSLLCNSSLSEDTIKIILDFIPDSDEIKEEYLAFGPEKIKAMGCSNMSKIRKTLSVKSFDKEFLSSEIYKEFKEGDRILFPELKIRLGELYTKIGYKATPKATDILKYFEAKEVMNSVTDSDGSKRRLKKYELLKKKKG